MAEEKKVKDAINAKKVVKKKEPDDKPPQAYKAFGLLSPRSRG